MNPQEDLGNKVKAHIKLEENTTKKIKELEEATANLAARLFLAEMRFDTEKHAKILKTMQDLMKQKEPEAARETLWETRIHSYIDAVVAKKMLEDHIKVETDMLKRVEEEIERTDDDALKLLFQHIADDEKKHHKIMETILRKAYEMGP
jgi:bacterioferritin (cytochrome b1)